MRVEIHYDLMSYYNTLYKLNEIKIEEFKELMKTLNVLYDKSEDRDSKC